MRVYFNNEDGRPVMAGIWKEIAVELCALLSVKVLLRWECYLRIL